MGTRKGLTLIAALALLDGCANYSTLQTPETVPERAAEIGFGGTYNNYTLEIETTSTSTAPDGTTVTDTSTSREDFGVPALALWLRYGITDRLEIHGLTWLPLGTTVGGKYMLVGERDQPGFIFSPGLDLSVPLEISVNDDSTILFDLYTPMHLGYRANESFAVYLTPKYVLRFVDDNVGHSVGGTLGVAIGDETTFLIEGGVYQDTLVDDQIINGAIGIGFE
ncbi:MAG: hypothetical protein OXT09_01815 [Myxococcales bacterium]|nr:hypothetical protein [Myxococcales bacterium]